MTDEMVLTFRPCLFAGKFFFWKVNFEESEFLESEFL